MLPHHRQGKIEDSFWVMLFCGPRLLLCGPYYTVLLYCMIVHVHQEFIILIQEYTESSYNFRP